MKPSQTGARASLWTASLAQETGKRQDRWNLLPFDLLSSLIFLPTSRRTQRLKLLAQLARLGRVENAIYWALEELQTLVSQFPRYSFVCLGGREDNDIETTAYSWQDPIGNSHRRIIGRISLINMKIVSFSQSPIERVQPWQARREQSCLSQQERILH